MSRFSKLYQIYACTLIRSTIVFNISYDKETFTIENTNFDETWTWTKNGWMSDLNKSY